MKINHYYQNVILSPPSEEAEAGSGGDQPVRNILTERNGNGGSLPHHFSYSDRLCLRKRIASLEAKKRTEYATNKQRKRTVINPKKGQRISGQDTVPSKK